MGFGDGDQYISFGVDFDSGIGSFGATDYKGLLVYPPCGSSLAEGSVSDILSNSQQYPGNAFYEVRHALAGGSNDNWRQFGGERHDNGNNWPVTIEIENDEDANTVTLRFISENSGDDDLSEGTVECVYTGTFGAGEFTFGMLPDLGNGNKDNFNIESIEIAVTSTATSNICACSRHSDPYCCDGNWYDNDCLAECDGFEVERDCVGLVDYDGSCSQPSDSTTMAPSSAPSLAPTLAPSSAPSAAPSPTPSAAPSLAPSATPSLAPSV